jgi:hypothetical protein
MVPSSICKVDSTPVRCWLAWYPLGISVSLLVGIGLRVCGVCCNPANCAPEMRFYSVLELFIVIFCAYDYV